MATKTTAKKTTKKTPTNKKTPTKMRKPSSERRVFTLKVTLLDLEPEIWRIVEVASDMKLGRLHDVLQVAMGWQSSHLHMFRKGQVFYGETGFDDFGPPTNDEAKVTVGELLTKKGDKFVYIYDFGDDWHHEVELIELSAPKKGQKYPRLVAGERACPPEDCGGVPGYMNLLDALANPKHPERKDLLEWLGQEFDPSAFDLLGAARELSAHV